MKIQFTEKIKNVLNFYLISAILNDFMAYLRHIMNNFRTFKMQLREAELLNMNYLDYLIKEWQPTRNLIENMEKMKKEMLALKNIGLNYPSLTAYINMVLYTSYICKFDSRYFDEESKESRLWIMHGGKRNLIVISSKHNTEYKFQDAENTATVGKNTQLKGGKCLAQNADKAGDIDKNRIQQSGSAYTGFCL